ncbi:hypothetical protein DL764_000660 [Monosporascus ibericus]|uniref:Uncharacterized protein n=1 Tax=Monosporascus ibericus TaxID=155417 RepID=A0A4Q4TW46_9PEZI|nr:hypothetical protein DL764_000660 [Monosporascus ibericus]
MVRSITCNIRNPDGTEGGAIIKNEEHSIGSHRKGALLFENFDLLLLSPFVSYSDLKKSFRKFLKGPALVGISRLGSQQL